MQNLPTPEPTSRMRRFPPSASRAAARRTTTRGVQFHLETSPPSSDGKREASNSASRTSFPSRKDATAGRTGMDTAVESQRSPARRQQEAFAPRAMKRPGSSSDESLEIRSHQRPAPSADAVLEHRSGRPSPRAREGFIHTQQGRRNLPLEALPTELEHSELALQQSRARTGDPDEILILLEQSAIAGALPGGFAVGLGSRCAVARGGALVCSESTAHVVEPAAKPPNGTFDVVRPRLALSDLCVQRRQPPERHRCLSVVQ
jgi:hypothetical protein